MSAGSGDRASIRWRMHLSAPPQRVYELLSTDAGRASFWAESSEEHRGEINLRFPNGQSLTARILEALPGERFRVSYFDDTIATFELEPDGAGGAELTLTETGVPESMRCEQQAGWLNVLFPLKAMADHGVDLRNHDASRTWSQGYADG